jgi:xanthine/uracil permease
MYQPRTCGLAVVLWWVHLQVGDVTATAEVSRLAVDGPDFVRRIRGGMFNDAVSCLVSALSGSMPMTTFAQVCLSGGTGRLEG